MRRLILLLTLVFGLSGSASAESIISFTFASTDDVSFFWDGSSFGDLELSKIGSDIECLSCFLSIQVADFLEATETSWIFKEGGFFQITGGADLKGSGDPDDPFNIPDTDDDGSPTVLLSAIFADRPTITLMSPGDPDTGEDAVLRFEAIFEVLEGTLDARLAEFFGFDRDLAQPGSFWFEFTVPSPITGGEGFEATSVLDGTVTLINVSTIPEPPPVVLLAIALVGVVIARKFLPRARPR